MDKVFVVKNEAIKDVYFSNRKACIDYIVDELGMALVFRNDKEPEKLAEYLMVHNETPNQYEYKYYIEEISLNAEYDTEKTNERMYVVQCNEVCGGDTTDNVYLYDTYEEAKKSFDELVEHSLIRLVTYEKIKGEWVEID